MHETDETIYLRFLDGRSDDDMRILLDRHRESLTLFLNGIVHNIDDAEELMLDAFAVAASGTSRFGGRSSFRTWLFGIGRKLALTHLRRRRLYPEIAEAQADEADVPNDLDLISEERSRTLYAAMSRLNEDYRQILYLLYFEEMSHEEAARVMGRNVRQTYNLAHRGRQALRETLERMGFEYAGY
ncbi:MAG: RNA polymerase sigma factor [Oscillospiraceae bacterium]|nr:RNA polymerase sigma factor [Oscillospiraceae bacterium]